MLEERSRMGRGRAAPLQLQCLSLGRTIQRRSCSHCATQTGSSKTSLPNQCFLTHSLCSLLYLPANTAVDCVSRWPSKQSELQTQLLCDFEKLHFLVVNWIRSVNMSSQVLMWKYASWIKFSKQKASTRCPCLFPQGSLTLGQQGLFSTSNPPLISHVMEATLPSPGLLLYKMLIILPSVELLSSLNVTMYAMCQKCEICLSPPD